MAAGRTWPIEAAQQLRNSRRAFAADSDGPMSRAASVAGQSPRSKENSKTSLVAHGARRKLRTPLPLCHRRPREATGRHGPRPHPTWSSLSCSFWPVRRSSRSCRAARGLATEPPLRNPSYLSNGTCWPQLGTPVFHAAPREASQQAAAPRHSGALAPS